MVGTVTVTQGGGSTPGSGVDYTEYRVNTGGATGEWVRKDNTSSASPFVTTVPVSAAGSHVVEYRSKDKAGNTEATKSVAFSIQAASGSDSEDADVNADVPLVMSLDARRAGDVRAADPGRGEGLHRVDDGEGDVQRPEHVADGGGPSTNAPGHLVNGTRRSRRRCRSPPAARSRRSAAAPTLLKSWSEPLASDPVASSSSSLSPPPTSWSRVATASASRSPCRRPRRSRQSAGPGPRGVPRGPVSLTEAELR